MKKKKKKRFVATLYGKFMFCKKKIWLLAFGEVAMSLIYQSVIKYFV